jgi:cardiolipin synthase A/B
VVLGSDTADELESMFADDQKGAKAIDVKSWSERPLSQRMTETFAIALQKLL